MGFTRRANQDRGFSTTYAQVQRREDYFIELLTYSQFERLDMQTISHKLFTRIFTHKQVFFEIIRLNFKATWEKTSLENRNQNHDENKYTNTAYM